MTENTAVSIGVRRMLGLSLNIWTAIMLLSLGAAAIAAAVVGVSTYAVVQLQKQAAADAEEAFEKYKVTAKADADVKIAEATKEAAKANERAAALEKDAAALNARLADRSINNSAFVDALKDKIKYPTTIFYVRGDKESYGLAAQIKLGLIRADWTVDSISPKTPEEMSHFVTSDLNIAGTAPFGVTVSTRVDRPEKSGWENALKRDFNHQLRGIAIVDALNISQTGKPGFIFQVTGESSNIEAPPSDSVWIIVGQKP